MVRQRGTINNKTGDKTGYQKITQTKVGVTSRSRDVGAGGETRGYSDKTNLVLAVAPCINCK